MAKAEDYPNDKIGAVNGDDKILAIAKERFSQCLNSTDIIRAEALEDVMFVNNKQWLESLLKDRADDRRPALTINRLPAFISQVTNDMRQNRPAIKIRATDNQYKETADVIDGLVRSIIHNGDSKTAIDTAAYYQVVCGFGYIRVITRYVDDDSFDQEICLKRIDNPFAVYFPVHLCQELDFSDAPYCFIRSKMSKEEFKEKYPNSTTSSYDKQGAGDPNWMGEDYIYVAEYFEVEKSMEKLYLLSDGTTTDKKPDKKSGLTVEKERDVEERKVTWRLMSEFDVLDEKEWPSKYLPIIPALGQEINENGKKSFVSLTRNSKDPQRMYNFMFSGFAEAIALAPRSPFVVAEGQVDEFKAIWQTSNQKNHAYLPYTPTSLEGQPIPPPQRTMPPEAGQSLVLGINMASEQLKETTGIYDASLGAKGNETSGKAIVARQKEGDTANFHFTDNMSKTMNQIGRILVDLIPEIYDTPRAIQILGPDMAQDVVDINQANPKTGKLYDVTTGKYEVQVDIGPGYETKRTEILQGLVSVFQAVPQVGAVLGDMVLRLMDFPESEEAADRIKRYIMSTMPGVIIDEGSGPGEPLNEGEIQQVIMDLKKVTEQHLVTMRENQQMQMIIQQLQAQLKDKQEDRQIDMDKTVIKANAEVQKAEMEHQHESNMNAQQAELGLRNQLLMHRISPEKPNYQGM